MDHLKVLVIGGGGREHALVWKLAQSSLVDKVYVAPGNAGTAKEDKTTNVGDLKVKDHQAVADWCHQNNINLVVVGPEDPLAEGIKDSLSTQGIKCFGPSKAAAQLEASKAYAKDFMTRHQIPTARWQAFTDPAAAKQHIQSADYKALVVKASGLAAGKGVIVAANKEEACQAVDSIMVDGSVGSAGTDKIVVEELLEGEEVSVLAFTDGLHASVMPPIQDHKRLEEGDQGPNTGGMGVYSPVPLATPALMSVIKKEIVDKTIEGMQKDNTPFQGILYSGLMITAEGPKVLEYNCRFGDPECQVAMSLLESDLAEVLLTCLEEGKLGGLNVAWRSGAAAAGVVVASQGYPQAYAKGKEITKLPEGKNLKVFHAGTALKEDGKVVTSGGRVLAVVATDSSLKEALAVATHGASGVKFDGAFYRRDIGHRALTPSGSGLTYQACGVDIDTADGLVGYIKKQASRTTRPGATSAVGGFGAIFDLQKEGRKSDTLLVSGTDGVGTKLLIAHAMGKHDTIGIDLVAMSVNDILCQGAEPLYFLDYFSTSHLDPAQFQDVIRGVAEGCYQAGCALTGGETAELPGVYPPKVFDLAGFAVGDVHPDKQLPRLDAIHPGDILVGFPSSGLHSNGFSLVRRLVETLELSYQGPAPFLPGDQCLGDVLLTPTRIYVKEVLPLVRQGWIKALAHITGGGLVNNIPRVLPSNVRAILDASKWNMHPVYPWIATQGKVSQEEMLRTFNLSIGLVAVVNPAHVKPLLEHCGPASGAAVIGQLEGRSSAQEAVTVSNLNLKFPGPVASLDVKKKVAVLISGSGTNLQSLLDHTASPLSASTIVLVISNRAGVLGLERARQAGVPTVVVSHKDFSNREDFDMEMHRHLKAAGVELICLAGFMRILSAKFVQLWHGRLINIHPSLLPSFPGAHAHRDALAAGVHITGCTVHFVEPSVDSGKIILQAAVPIQTGDTEDILQERVKVSEHRIFPRALELVARGKVTVDGPSGIIYSSM